MTKLTPNKQTNNSLNKTYSKIYNEVEYIKKNSFSDVRMHISMNNIMCTCSTTTFLFCINPRLEKIVVLKV